MTNNSDELCTFLQTLVSSQLLDTAYPHNVNSDLHWIYLCLHAKSGPVGLQEPIQDRETDRQTHTHIQTDIISMI